MYPQLRFIEFQSRVRINDAADCFGFFPQRVRIFRQRLQLRSAKYEIDIKVAAANIEARRIADAKAQRRVLLHPRAHFLHHVALRVITAKGGQRVAILD